MTDCERCGAAVEHGHGDRFRVRGYDFSESSASIFEGQLCRKCWDRFVEFMLGRLEQPGKIGGYA